MYAFQNHDIEDGRYGICGEEAVNEYLSLCKEYIPPESVPKKYTSFEAYCNNRIVIYQDTCRKPWSFMIIMVGKLTPDIVDRIKDGLNALYTTKCHECEKALTSKNAYHTAD